MRIDKKHLDLEMRNALRRVAMEGKIGGSAAVSYSPGRADAKTDPSRAGSLLQAVERLRAEAAQKRADAEQQSNPLMRAVQKLREGRQ